MAKRKRTGRTGCHCPAGSVAKSTAGRGGKKRGMGFVCIRTAPKTKTKTIGGRSLTYVSHPFVGPVCSGGRKAPKRRGKKRGRR